MGTTSFKRITKVQIFY